MTDSGGGGPWADDLPPTTQQPGVPAPPPTPGAGTPATGAGGAGATGGIPPTGGPGDPGGPGGPPIYPPASKPPPKTPLYKQPWPYAIAAAIILLASIIAYFSLRDEESGPTQPTTLPTTTTLAPTTTAAAATSTTVAPTTVATTVPPTTTTAAATTTAATTTTVPPTTTTAPPTFGTGLQPVGTGSGDVKPGIYVAPNVTNCTWQRLSGTDPTDPNDVIAEGTVNGQAIVEVESGDRNFNSTGCGSWTGYVAPAQPVNQFGEGQWVVGAAAAGQIVPGNYRTSGGPSCTWARLAGFSGDPADVITPPGEQNAPTTATVAITATDAGFTSTQCGTWTKVG